MKNEKIGTIFIVSTLALAGIGISYAGFSDSIFVYGTVDTGTVDLKLEGFSCTYVWKIYDFIENWQIPLYLSGPGQDLYISQEEEIVIYHGPCIDPSQIEGLFVGDSECTIELISWAEAEEGTEDDTVIMDYHNLFPCIDFTADFIVHYIGSIPAKINTATIFSGNPWLQDLWAMYQQTGTYGAWVEAYRWDPDTLDFMYDDAGNRIPVDVGYQLHDCYYVWVGLTIHLPQMNEYQGLSGTFVGMVEVIQWNDQCDDQSIDLPPIVEIYSAENGQGWQIDVSASDDYGIVSTGYIWEWTGGSEAASGTVNPPETYINNIGGYFWLKDGWNKITFFAYDTAGQYGEDIFEYTYP